MAEESANNPLTEPATGSAGGSRLVLGVRFRVALLILASQAALIWWVADSEIIRGIYLICYSLMMPTVLYLLLGRIFCRGSGRRGARWALFEEKELLLSYIVLTCTLPIAGFGGLRFIIAGAGYLSFFEKSQPQWAKYLPLHNRLAALGDPDAVVGLYRGAPQVPWHAWTAPIIFWSAYLLLLVGIAVSLAVVLRRVWIHQERLPFPIAVLPIQLMDRRENILRSPLLWLGFALPAVFQSLLVFHNWWPAVPAFQLKAYYLNFKSPPWNASPGFAIGLYPMAVGLAYFVPGDVSLSCWLLALLTKFTYIIGAAFGVEPAASGTPGFPYADEQSCGAWVGLAGLVLWGAKKQWQAAAGLVSPEELRPARTAAFAAASCAMLCVVMMAAAGIPGAAAIGIIVVFSAYMIAGARIRAEAGGQWTFAPVVTTPHRAAFEILGTRTMNEGSLAASGYFSLIHVDIRAQSLPYLMEGMDIAERSGIRWQTVVGWVAMGSVTALAFGWWASLVKFYEVGAASAKANPYPLVKANIAFKEIERLLWASRAPNVPASLAIAAGAGITALLAWLRRAGLFGLHPIGYVMSNTLIMNAFILPFFIAWLAKTSVLRLGGGTAYRRSVPFFAGIVLGDVVIQGFWALFGWIFDVPIYQFLT